MAVKKRDNKKVKNKKSKLKKDRSFRQFPNLMAIKPREKYHFHSDYFNVDGQVACIVSFFHSEGANDSFGAFWGINKIPSGLEDGVTCVLFEQTRRMSESWLKDNQNRSEQIATKNEKEQKSGGTNSTKGVARRRTQDLQEIAQELQDQAAYLNVHYRMLVKAPTLKMLDDALTAIDRLYIDRFGTLSVAAYAGEQRAELANLFAKNAKKQGRGFYFTSTEFAGSYNLVTHGLADPAGEYIGYMVGDVNNSAVLFDVDKYEHHTVIVNERVNEKLGRVQVSDMWGSKLSQACMLRGGRVVHLVLNGADLDKLGPKFERLTHRIDMNNGDVNMFEMFGKHEDELAIFPTQMQKLILMAEQAYETTESDRSIIRGSLEEIATQFYIDSHMWYENAKENRDKLRVTGIPHVDVPRLQMFVAYLDMRYKAMVNQTARDDKRLNAISVLRFTFKNMLSNNGDLFNSVTSDAIDGAKSGKRVVYDFSKLSRRGTGIAMAQLVNIIGYAVDNLEKGDTVVIHGAEMIDAGVKPYIMTQFERLYNKGGRVAYLYNNMDKMLSDKEFNTFDKADYTVFGTMTESTMDAYQKLLGQKIPDDLSRLISNKTANAAYIRRGFDNVVFSPDLLLGLPPKGGV